MKRRAVTFFFNRQRRSGFSLIEVVLAIGIFLITVLALVGLLGPTLKSVDEVEKTDEVSSIVNTVNAFLQSSPDIAGSAGSKFNAIYAAVKDQNYATLFVFREYIDGSSNDSKIAIGFHDDDADSGSDGLKFKNEGDFSDAVGTIYRVVLSPSSVIPETYRSAGRTNGIYTLNTELGDYLEGYFAMEVRIFAEELSAGRKFNVSKTIADLANTPDIFTYNTAIVR